MKVERIDVLSFYVKDLEKSVKFFSELLGSEFIGPIVKDTYVPDELREKAKAEERHVKVAIDNLGIQLLQASSPDDSISRWIEEHGEGVASIGLKVPDMDEAITELEAKGFKLTYRTVGSTATKVDGKEIPGRSEIKAALLKAPGDAYGGLQFYLLEYKETSGFALATLRKMGDLPRM